MKQPAARAAPRREGHAASPAPFDRGGPGARAGARPRRTPPPRSTRGGRASGEAAGRRRRDAGVGGRRRARGDDDEGRRGAAGARSKDAPTPGSWPTSCSLAVEPDAAAAFARATSSGATEGLAASRLSTLSDPAARARGVAPGGRRRGAELHRHARGLRPLVPLPVGEAVLASLTAVDGGLGDVCASAPIAPGRWRTSSSVGAARRRGSWSPPRSAPRRSGGGAARRGAGSPRAACRSSGTTTTRPTHGGIGRGPCSNGRVTRPGRRKPWPGSRRSTRLEGTRRARCRGSMPRSPCSGDAAPPGRWPVMIHPGHRPARPVAPRRGARRLRRGARPRPGGGQPALGHGGPREHGEPVRRGGGTTRRSSSTSSETYEDFRASGQLEATALSVGNLGAAYRALGDLDRAREHLEQALRLAKELGNPVLEARTT